ncbi:Rho GTPase activation protein, partial [Umbelopsis sp. AD052]
TLPANLQREITQFVIDGFAKKYFSTHKKGLFRRKVPMEEMLQWTKDSIKQPLMMLNKDLHKDALKSFKLIQMIMGDRSRPRNSSANEDLQWLCNCGITQGQMRDEIYVQVCKQLNNNPNKWSVLKGWEILCVITITFPPSKNLESYLTEFVKQYHNQKENKMDVMSQHVSSKLIKICSRGAKGKVLTVAEIERAKDAPFKPSVFGETLEFIMEQQASTTDLDIPKIVPFLANMVLELNGLTSEGIFRVPGDADDVTELRIRIENGRYESAGITDPNVPASLLKYWLRDLAKPLILTEYYESCIKYSEDINQAIEVIQNLPDVNRRIVLYMANFLAKFTAPESTQLTRMNVNNLAMVFAPNFLRCPYDSLTRVFENSKWEQAFLRTLIENTELLNEKL